MCSLAFLALAVERTVERMPESPETYPVKGLASWYDARHPATGKRYLNNNKTCALRRNDYGAYYQVCSVDTGRCVIVRHNDFGPRRRLFFRQGRIIDLSKEAFSVINNPDDGLIKVRIRKITDQEAIKR
jgi:rare lipoprotein A